MTLQVQSLRTSLYGVMQIERSSSVKLLTSRRLKYLQQLGR